MYISIYVYVYNTVYLHAPYICMCFYICTSTYISACIPICTEHLRHVLYIYMCIYTCTCLKITLKCDVHVFLQLEGLWRECDLDSVGAMLQQQRNDVTISLLYCLDQWRWGTSEEIRSTDCFLQNYDTSSSWPCPRGAQNNNHNTTRWRITSCYTKKKKRRRQNNRKQQSLP